MNTKKVEQNRLIYIVDDEPDICEMVDLHLQKNGFKTRKFFNGTELIKELDNELPDLIVLDIMLPDISGTDICKILKARKRTASIPIIMLTAKGEEDDRVLGFEVGADDYVVKPFYPRELVARIQAVLRRHTTISGSEKVIKVGNILEIDENKYEVYVKGKKITLTPTEFKILVTLASNPGRVFSRKQLLDVLWGNEKIVLDRTIDVHIKNLRDKLGNAGKFIESIRGIGYKFSVNPQLNP